MLLCICVYIVFRSHFGKCSVFYGVPCPRARNWSGFLGDIYIYVSSFYAFRIMLATFAGCHECVRTISKSSGGYMCHYLHSEDIRLSMGCYEKKLKIKSPESRISEKNARDFMGCYEYIRNISKVRVYIFRYRQLRQYNIFPECCENVRKYFGMFRMSTFFSAFLH